MRSRLLAAAAALLLLGISLSAAASPDEGVPVKGDERRQARMAVTRFVLSQTTNGVWPHYDPVGGELLQLAFQELHQLTVRKGDFILACADFSDQHGRSVDVDILVSAEPLASGELRVTQALVHAIDGKTRAYDLSRR